MDTKKVNSEPKDILPHLGLLEDDSRGDVERLFAWLPAGSLTIWRSVHCFGCDVDAVAVHTQTSPVEVRRVLRRCERLVEAVGVDHAELVEQQAAFWSPMAKTMRAGVLRGPREARPPRRRRHRVEPDTKTKPARPWIVCRPRTSSEQRVLARPS